MLSSSPSTKQIPGCLWEDEGPSSGYESRLYGAAPAPVVSVSPAPRGCSPPGEHSEAAGSEERISVLPGTAPLLQAGTGEESLLPDLS